MIVKRYGNDWAKEKSRSLSRRTLDESIFRFKKPSKVKILHLGGADLEEAKGYIAQGVFPKNIVSVEREAEIALEQERLKTGVKVEKTTLEKYVGDARQIDFDFVSLDYTCPITFSHIDLIKDICRKQTNNTFVLHVANLLRRDDKSNLLYSIVYPNTYDTELTQEEERIAEGFSHLPSSILPTAAKHLNLTSRLKNGESIKEIKPLLYGKVVQLGYNTSINDGGDIQKVFDFLIGKDKKRVALEMQREASQIFEKFQIDPDNIAGFAYDTPVSMQFYSIFTRRFLEDKMRAAGVTRNIDFQFMHFIMPKIVTGARPFHELSRQGYSYVSESGSPMAGSIVVLRKPYRFNQLLDEVARSVGSRGYFEIQDKFKFEKLVDRCAAVYSKELLENQDLGANEENLFLGNSSKPVLSKRRAIEEFESGASVEEVQQKYRGWTNKPLAQWKAHVSMGTYSSRKDIEGVVEDREDSDLEKITKEDAVDLLSSGVPPAEIYSCYPTSFSIGQLRAYKAHITMGSYQNGNNGSLEGK